MRLQLEHDEPDSVVRKVQTVGSHNSLCIVVPPSWAKAMGIEKGTQVQLDLSATREKITIRKAVLLPPVVEAEAATPLPPVGTGGSLV